MLRVWFPAAPPAQPVRPAAPPGVPFCRNRVDWCRVVLLARRAAPPFRPCARAAAAPPSLRYAELSCCFYRLPSINTASPIDQPV